MNERSHVVIGPTAVAVADVVPRRNWAVSGASVAGRAHLAAGRECQDAWKAAWSADGRALCLAVADGAGSQSRAAEGASLAVGLSVDLLARFLARFPSSADQWREVMQRALRAVVDEFRRVTALLSPDGDLAPFATTVTAAVLAPPWCGLMSIGNCFVVAVTSGDHAHDTGYHLVLEPPPDPGEYANQTTFIVSDDALARSRAEAFYCEDLTGLVMCSDGCIEIGIEYEGDEPVRPSRSFFQQVVRTGRTNADAADLVHLLTGEAVSRADEDDKTVVVALDRGARL